MLRLQARVLYMFSTCSLRVIHPCMHHLPCSSDPFVYVGSLFTHLVAKQTNDSASTTPFRSPSRPSVSTIYQLWSSSSERRLCHQLNCRQSATTLWRPSCPSLCTCYSEKSAPQAPSLEVRNSNSSSDPLTRSRSPINTKGPILDTGWGSFTTPKFIYHPLTEPWQAD